MSAFLFILFIELLLTSSITTRKRRLDDYLETEKEITDGALYLYGREREPCLSRDFNDMKYQKSYSFSNDPDKFTGSKNQSLEVCTDLIKEHHQALITNLTKNEENKLCASIDEAKQEIYISSNKLDLQLERSPYSKLAIKNEDIIRSCIFRGRLKKGLERSGNVLNSDIKKIKTETSTIKPGEDFLEKINTDAQKNENMDLEKRCCQTCYEKNQIKEKSNAGRNEDNVAQLIINNEKTIKLHLENKEYRKIHALICNKLQLCYNFYENFDNAQIFKKEMCDIDFLELFCVRNTSRQCDYDFRNDFANRILLNRFEFKKLQNCAKIELKTENTTSLLFTENFVASDFVLTLIKKVFYNNNMAKNQFEFFSKNLVDNRMDFNKLNANIFEITQNINSKIKKEYFVFDTSTFLIYFCRSIDKNVFYLLPELEGAIFFFEKCNNNLSFNSKRRYLKYLCILYAFIKNIEKNKHPYYEGLCLPQSSAENMVALKNFLRLQLFLKKLFLYIINPFINENEFLFYCDLICIKKFRLDFLFTRPQNYPRKNYNFIMYKEEFTISTLYFYIIKNGIAEDTIKNWLLSFIYQICNRQASINSVFDLNQFNKEILWCFYCFFKSKRGNLWSEEHAKFIIDFELELCNFKAQRILKSSVKNPQKRRLIKYHIKNAYQLFDKYFKMKVIGFLYWINFGV